MSQTITISFKDLVAMKDSDGMNQFRLNDGALCNRFHHTDDFYEAEVGNTFVDASQNLTLEISSIGEASVEAVLSQD